MSALARYPVPQAVASGAIDKPRLYFRVEPTAVETKIQLVRFDGSNDWLSNAVELTGNADSKVGTGSMWIRFEGGDGVSQTIYRSDTGQVFIHKTTGNVIQIIGRNAVGDLRLQLDSNSTYTVASGIIHVCWAYDLGAGTGRLFVDDVDDLAASPTLIDDTIDYTDDGYGFGATELVGSNKITACVGQVYLNFAEFLDINDVDTRRRFISPNGVPVSLGSDGSNPTGTAPIIFFDGAVASWHTNAGAGGGFVENGEITDCGVYPQSLDFLQPLRGLEQGIVAGKVDEPRFYFDLEPVIIITAEENIWPIIWRRRRR